MSRVDSQFARHADLIAILEPLARHFFGEPNYAMSSKIELRFGSRGSLSIDLAKGVWHDHEDGKGGGVLDLIERHTGHQGADCIRWLEDNGFLKRCTKPRIVKTYDYQDENGTLLFQVVRLEPKNFRQRRPDPAKPGEWIWSVKGVRQVPYRLPDVLEAIALGKAIFLPEGEKDVDRLWALGIPATCNAGGAGKWRPELSAFFTGTDVVPIPDNDPQKCNPHTGEPQFHPDGRPVFPGQDHAQAVATALARVAARVRLLDLKQFWRDMPLKGDLSDWLDRGGGSPKALYALVDRLPTWTAPDDPPQSKQHQQQRAFRFPLIPFRDFAPLPGDDYTVKDFLPRTGLAVFWGEPKSGKSFFVFDLLMHVALGWDYCGHRVRQGPVIYVCLEGGRAFRKRREAFRQAKLKDGEDPQFYFVVNPLSLADDRNALIEDIRRQVAPDVPAAVCIDTLNRSLAGSENSDKDMASYIKAADAIRDAFDCLVLVVHHCGHEGARPRDHSSLMGALDVQIAVSRDAEQNVVAELELAKDGETGLVFVSRLERVEIGRDVDGDPITSCVVREVEGAEAKVAAKAAAAKPAKGRRSDDVEKVKRAIVEAYGRLAVDAPKTLGFDGKPVTKVKVAALRNEVKSRGFLEISETGGLTQTARTHFHRAKTDLFDSKRYIEAEGMFWKLASDPLGF
jgi:hypothetical protein